MKIKDLIKMHIDVDVYDDVCDEIGIAFCGPIELTDKGKEEFADVLEYDCYLNDGTCIVEINKMGDDWEAHLYEAAYFFKSMAGYCSWSQWNEWVKANRFDL